jgi:hypothetical protein
MRKLRTLQLAAWKRNVQNEISRFICTSHCETYRCTALLSQVLLYRNAYSIVRTSQYSDARLLYGKERFWFRDYNSAFIKALYLELLNRDRVHASCHVAPPLAFSRTRYNYHWADVTLLLWFLVYCMHYDRAGRLLLLVSCLAYSPTLKMRQ